MPAINTSGSLAFCAAARRERRGSIIYASKRKLSDPTMSTDKSRSARLVYRARCRWLISAWQSRRGGWNCFCWTSKIILGLKRVYFYNGIFGSVGRREVAKETDCFRGLCSTHWSGDELSGDCQQQRRPHTGFSVAVLFYPSDRCLCCARWALMMTAARLLIVVFYRLWCYEIHLLET